MHYLSRRTSFSATHSYYISDWTPEENLRIFGPCSNRNGHGHDFELEIMVKGSLNEKSGIVVNTTDIKRIVNHFIDEELDGKFLDREHSYFQKHLPTTENLVQYIWDSLKNRFEGCQLHRIRLFENHYLSAEKEEGLMVRLTRKYHFCAAHRLHSECLSDEENERIFGKCNNPHGHGHNYDLDISIEGEPDPITGMVMNLTELDELINRVVLDKLDHKHLNLDTDEFQHLNPTSETVAMVIYNMLYAHLPQLYRIGLWETKNNYFEYYGDEKRAIL